MYLNKVILIGNLTRDPELKTLPSGVKVCTMGLATNRVWKDKNGAKQEDAQFHNIVIFGNQAEIVAQYLRKGQSALVEGRMQTRSWDDQSGKKQYRTEIVANRVQFGPKSGGGYVGSQTSDVKGAPTSDVSDSPKTIQYPEEEINAEDIPF